MQDAAKIPHLEQKSGSDGSLITLPNGVKIQSDTVKWSDSAPKEKEKSMQKESIQEPERNIKTIPMVPQNKTPDGNEENPIESYEPLSETLRKDLLVSVTMLNESMKPFHSETVRLMTPPESEMQVIPINNMAEARANADVLAKLMQTKINFIKALKK